MPAELSCFFKLHNTKVQYQSMRKDKFLFGESAFCNSGVGIPFDVDIAYNKHILDRSAMTRQLIVK